MFLLLKTFTRRVAEFGDKNYPKACWRGVFSNKVRKRKAQKHSKGFLLFFSKFIATLHKTTDFFQKIPLKFAHLVFLLYLCTNFTAWNDGRTTVERQSNDSQSQC